MHKNNRPIKIQQIINKIEHSHLSVNQYFKKRNVPFGYRQYYIYKKIIEEKGIEGLTDQREQGNRLKFTDKIKTYIKGVLDNNRSITSSEIKTKIDNEFEISISVTAINRFRQENNLSLVRLDKESTLEASGAAEMAVAIALHTGQISEFADFIYNRVQNKKRTKQFRQSFLMEKDCLDQRSKGKFTSQYNKLPEVRKCRFKSIEEKIPHKKFDSMRIFSLSKESITKYCISLFVLPLVTSNGRCRSVNSVKGNALKYLCGFNYKAATIDKHIRELKYLQISNGLIEETAKFWFNFWRSRNKTESIFTCFYIDGNTKALWSSKRCHKGKVTMLGKVMNCIETLFIHDGQGHPIYFKTFNGHADLGTNGLKMIDKITEFLNDSTEAKNKFAVNRILIMDGGGNAVKILREIIDYYYITILDDNQITNRKLKSISEEKRYDHGEAFLIDCKIELKDSNEKNYIYETRAVQVKWDNGKTSTLVTNLPTDLFSSDNVVKSYFDRWPMQELDFKSMKSAVNIHRMAGYGKILVDNTNVIEKIEELQTQKKRLEDELKIPLTKINRLEKDLQSLIRKERIYREKGTIVEGKRNFKYQKDEQMFEHIQKQIYKINKKIKDIKKLQGKSFNSLKKKKDELARIIDKKKRYHVDVELDQLMTCFKMSFANICRYLLDECFEGNKMSFQKLFESIFDLSGKVKVEGNQRRIAIEGNPKEVEVLEILRYGLQIINSMQIKNINGDIYNFSLV